MTSKMTPEQLRAEVAKFDWYHKIDLGQGVITPGNDWDSLWNPIREVRRYIEYEGKRVLDIGSWDGMWAFEAEKLGAEIVVATDCFYKAYKNFLFCREILGSKVIPYYNISPYDLVERLDVYLQEDFERPWPPLNLKTPRSYDRLFDIVQHLGLLYHLRDPLRSLLQARSCLRTHGYMLLETAVVINSKKSFMLFNGAPPAGQRIYRDVSTWWAPTIACLNEVLQASLFQPIDDTIRFLTPAQKPVDDDTELEISRVSLVARAVGPEEVDSVRYRELTRTYRTPGLAVEHLNT